MKDKANLWRLYNSATAYGIRASEFFDLETDLGRWSLDEACLMVGRQFENEINKGKNPFASEEDVKKQYKTVPRNLVKKKKIKADGTW